MYLILKQAELDKEGTEKGGKAFVERQFVLPASSIRAAFAFVRVNIDFLSSLVEEFMHRNERMLKERRLWLN